MLELATRNDHAAVNALARQVHALHVGWRPDIFRMPEGEMYTEERFLEAVRERQMYVAKLGGIVVGYALIRIRDSHGTAKVTRRILELEELCVDEALRGQGLGMRMMEEVHALARAFGCTDLQLNVYPQNDDAVAFYQKCGFAIRSIDMQRKV